MTTKIITSVGASSVCEYDWNSIDWKKVKKHIQRLQMRIAKAVKEHRWGKVKSLQRLLASSFYAKLLAIKRIMKNKGSKTPGIDGVIWRTSKQKMQAALSLKRKGYKAQPLRRIYIPKQDRKSKRPLSIPTMKCRAYQMLHLMALDPISETFADLNSYGFRKFRSVHDAIAQCFVSLSKKLSSKYILEGDIKACFDKISHEWLLNNIPMDKIILKKWLKAGYIEAEKFCESIEGVGQGSVISPVIMNMTLDGLERVVKKASKVKYGVNFIRYADDWLVTAPSKEILEERVKPVIEKFLADRGLMLSDSKTKITHIEDGFDFLGFNIRKYKGKLLIKPSKKNIKSFLDRTRQTMKQHKAVKAEVLIRKLNPSIRGWANQYSNVVAKKTFSYVDHNIFEALRRWSIRRHPNKGKLWIKKKYFHSKGLQNYIFFDKIKDDKGTLSVIDLIKASSTPIRRHIKIKAAANPYDPEYLDYLKSRKSKMTTGSDYSGLIKA